ncbi:hypothetical protein HME9302_00504 [Alteripontixanthobacter maritimus]|uniref:Uncharacterized protein n=1 Tax=Alteripontixanthobacter maritimus TaxID=2161824 RepID=A0A369Q7Q7_9SPHN|nr:hypothetical protein HME9302_00504 [Alteripontixanthobacter maritimus]
MIDENCTGIHGIERAIWTQSDGLYIRIIADAGENEFGVCRSLGRRFRDRDVQPFTSIARLPFLCSSLGAVIGRYRVPCSREMGGHRPTHYAKAEERDGMFR